MSGLPALVDLNLNATYGATLIGVLVSAVLFGVTNLQMFIYFSNYSSDGIFQKCAVCWLWFLDAFHLALTAHGVYYYLVSNFGNLLALEHIVWSFKLQIVIDFVVIISVQILYTMRIWILYPQSNLGRGTRVLYCIPKAKLIPILVSGLVFSALIVGVVLCSETYKYHDYIELYQMAWTMYLSLGTVTVTDIAIACALCYFLGKHRKGSKLNSTITVLMMYTLNTGIITSLVSITAIASYAAMPHNFIFISVEFLFTKLYVNSFMAMFNSRHYLQERSNTGIAQIQVSKSMHRTIDFSLPVLSPTYDERSISRLSEAAKTHEVERIGLDDRSSSWVSVDCKQ